jgi:tetratricopeptide (TPR) repeat protein/predicted Ser/Thr protein kinase
MNDPDQAGSKKGPAFAQLPPDLESVCDAATERPEAISTGRTPDDNRPRAATAFPYIDGYRIERKLGQGGMGAVFLARDERLGRQVAIKVVPQLFRDKPGLRARFQAEIQTLAALEHPKIARLYTAGHSGDVPYFVMEYVDGPTLDQFAREPLKPAEAASIVVQLCEGVAWCHAQGVLHRDLKPANVLMAEGKHPRIADFGLARAIGGDSSSTRTGEILGTPGYMSPEQASGVVRTLTPACDVYSLGAILYRLITGRAPFVADEPLHAVMLVLSEEPVRPARLNAGVPADLETICLKCLEKVPGRRYESAAALRDDLQRFLDGRPIIARPAGPVYRTIKWARRRPAAALLAVVAVLAIVAGLAGLAWHNRVLSRELARTERLAEQGSGFSQWLIEEHLPRVVTMSGSTDVTHDLLEQLRQYLDASLADMPPDPRYTRRLGYSYARLAAVSGGPGVASRGNLDDAVKYYEQAIALYDQAEAGGSEPLVLERLRTDSYLSLAAVYAEKAEPEKRDHYLELARSALGNINDDSADTQNLRIQFRIMEIEQLIDTLQFAEALASLDEISEMIEAARSGEIRPESIENHSIWLASARGRCHEALGNLEAAESAFETAVELARAGSEKRPADALAESRYSSMLVQHGDIQFTNSRAEPALEQYTTALEIAARLARMDPSSVELAADHAQKLARVSSVQQYLGNFEEAASHIHAAITILQDLEAAGKSSLTLQRSRAEYMLASAGIQSNLGNYERADKLLGEHQALCESLLKVEPSAATERIQLAENHFQRGVNGIQIWLGSDFDPLTARESQQYLAITRDLDACLRYFDEVAQLNGPSYHQEQFAGKARKIRAFLEESLDKLIEQQKAGQGNEDF